MITELEHNPLLTKWSSLGFVNDGFMGWSIPCPAIYDIDTEEWRTHMDRVIEAHMARTTMCRKYAWAIPAPEVIDWIAARFHLIVEIGAGRGYWAALLAKQGVNVIAYDKHMIDGQMAENHYFKDEDEDQDFTLYHPVYEGDETKAAIHSDRTLMLCWPPYDTSMAFNCLTHYKGNDLIYIGEGNGGCCGDDKFWDLIEAEWEEVDSQRIPQWPCIRDYLCHFARKAK